MGSATKPREERKTVVLLSGGLGSSTILAIAKAKGLTPFKDGVDYSITLTCYDPVGDQACGECDACAL